MTSVARGWWLLWCVGWLASCRCGVITTPAEADLRLSAITLDFGQVWVGDQTQRSVTLTNTGTASLEVRASVSSGPFSTGSSVRLGGGGNEELAVVFAPTASGLFEAGVTLTWADQSRVVTLRGEGKPVPSCTGEPCASSAFSFDAGVCIRTVRSDDTACTDACGGQGTCVSGSCRAASAASCDDGNACTLDACGADAGCVHLEQPVNVADPCQVYRCEPDAGVVSEPAEDGLQCGTQTCRNVHVCVNGTCAERPTTNLDDDCSYVDVDPSGTCFVTRSGRLRCFGFLDGGALGMSFVPGATRVKKAVTASRWLDLDDALLPTNPFAPLGLTAFTEVSRTPFGVLHAVTTNGVFVEHTAPSTDVVLLDAGVVGLCGESNLARLADGGLFAPSGFTPPGAVDCVTSSLSGPTWFLKSDGSLVDSNDALLLQGVTRLSRYEGPLVMRGAQVLGPLLDGGFTLRDTWPELPETVSGSSSRLCGTASTGNAWCEGALPGTLGSRNPNAPVDLPGGPWDQLDPPRTGSVTWWFGAGSSPDGGLSTAAVRHDWGPRTVDRASGDCVLSGREMWCARSDGGEVKVGDDVVSIEGGCGVTSAGQLWCPAAPRDGVLPGSNDLLWFPIDGGVGTPSYLLPDGGLGLQPRDVTFPLPGPVSDSSRATIYSGGCFAVLGAAYCTENGSTPTRMPVRFGVRKLSGGLRAGCAIIGSNRVECWGSVEARFRVIQFPVEVMDLEVRSASTTVGCVLLRGGAVQCFGSNFSGELGVEPQRTGFTRVDQ